MNIGLKTPLYLLMCVDCDGNVIEIEMVSTDVKEKFPILKAVFDNDLKVLSSLLSSHDADEKDQFGEFLTITHNGAFFAS